MPKIYSPNPKYTGLSASVSFVDGVGETDDNYLIQWFKEKGYKVEEREEIIEDKFLDIGEEFIEDVEVAFDLALVEDAGPLDGNQKELSEDAELTDEGAKEFVEDVEAVIDQLDEGDELQEEIEKPQKEEVKKVDKRRKTNKPKE